MKKLLFIILFLFPVNSFAQQTGIEAYTDSMAITGSVGITGQPISISGNVGVSGEVDVTPASPVAGTYIPVRLTDGSGFYVPGSAAIAQTYTWQITKSATGASKLYADMFNAVGSGKIIKIYGIYPIAYGDVGVTGVVAVRFDFYRTSAVGTGGSAWVYKSATIDIAGGNVTPLDTINSALPAQITGRTVPTGGATISEWMESSQCYTEEVNASTYICSGQTNFTQNTGQYRTLREGQGLLIKQGTVASVGNMGFRILFTVE